MESQQKKIYLDYAATTPLDGAVLDKIKLYFSEKYGNPASVHSFGQEAQLAVEEARGQVASFLNCQPAEVVFTSGATESNNLAIKGVVRAFQLRHRGQGIKPHLIVSRIEHHCVLDSAKSLQDDGLAEVTYLPVNSDGLVELGELERIIKGNTVLVSVMYANNEIGTVQPIAEIGRLLKDRHSNLLDSKIIFHTDAVQALNYLDCDVEKLGVDLMSMSGHKIYGPKGVGALYARQGTPLARIQDGGSQEYNLRAGTLNVTGIVGLGVAVAAIKDSRSTIETTKALRDKLIDGILKTIPNSVLNGSRDKRLPNNANLRFEGAEGEAILMSLDIEGIAVSTASACASRSLKPSHVLVSLGLAALDAHSSVRFSLGRQTTEEEINWVLEVLPKVIERLRKISGGILGERKQERLPDDFGC